MKTIYLKVYLYLSLSLLCDQHVFDSTTDGAAHPRGNSDSVCMEISRCYIGVPEEVYTVYTAGCFSHMILDILGTRDHFGPLKGLMWSPENRNHVLITVKHS